MVFPSKLWPSSGSKFRHSWEFVLLIAIVACVLVVSFWKREMVYSIVDSHSEPPPAVENLEPSQDHDVGQNSGQNSTGSSGTFNTSDAVPNSPPLGVIIETEMTPNLIPLMLHFGAVLGPAWKIVLFTLEEHWALPPSPSFRRAVTDQRIEIRFLPPATRFKNSASVSRFLTEPWLWEQVQSAERILLFQSDSIICSKASTTVEDFFAYDFVGAPIAARYGKGYNGGLSLRNPSLFLRITEESSFANSSIKFEDQWFYTEAMARVGDGVQLPTEDVAKTFAVETIYYETPLGYHQPSRWQAKNIEQIEGWCPESKMLIGRRAG